MRIIDSMKFYTPHADERMRVNIPDSTERLNLHSQKDVMVFCGGRAGVHFSTEVY